VSAVAWSSRNALPGVFLVICLNWTLLVRLTPLRTGSLPCRCRRLDAVLSNVLHSFVKLAAAP
jgi:hypothetical protein